MTAFLSKQVGDFTLSERPGAGSVAVLLHGIGSNAASFAPVVPHLPADWRVLAWDAPGYGGSAPLDKPWPGSGDYAQALAALLDALGVQRAYLMGHSLGALIAARFACLYPARVSRLVLASPALGYGLPEGAALGPAAQARIDDLDRLGATAFAAARAARLVHRAQDNPSVVAAVQGAMAAVRQPGYGQAVRMLASGDLLADATRLAVPVSVITGAEDLVTPPEGAARVHAALPAACQGSLTLVPDCGHAMASQAPGALASAMTRHTDPVC